MYGRDVLFSSRKLKIIEEFDVPSGGRPTLPGLVTRDWLERLCTLQVLASHGDRDASAILQEWCAHDPEAHEVRVSLTTTCRAVRLSDGH